MKKNILLIVLLCYSFYINSQEYSICNDGSGNSYYFIAKMSDTTIIKHIKNDDMLTKTMLLNDNNYIIPANIFNHENSSTKNKNSNEIIEIESGSLPEADLPYKISYTPDGEKLVVIYFHSNNVVIYKTSNNEVLAEINIGEGPIDMQVTEEKLYVCCYYSDEVYIINMDNYSIENTFIVEANPCLLEVNESETILYLGINSVYPNKGGSISAYGLSAYNKLFTTSWPHIEVVMKSGKIGRKTYHYSDFLLMGNDNYIACLKNSGDLPLILNATTGEIEKFFNIKYTFALATSKTKDSLYIAAQKADSMYFYCVDANTHKVIDSVIFKKYSMPLFRYWQDNLKVNNDGSKLYVEVMDLYFEDHGYLIDFGNHDHTVIELGSYFPIYNSVSSYDKRYVIGSISELRVFDFESENMIYWQYGLRNNSFTPIGISPTTDEFVLAQCNCNYYDTQDYYGEYLEVYNFSTPTNIVKTDSILCGSSPEADLTYSVVLNNTFDKIIAANPLSGNISIINSNSYLTDTIIDIQHISSIKKISDNLLALSGYDSPFLLIFDLETQSIIKQFDINNYFNIIPSPDNQYFYAYSREENILIKFSIEGNNINESGKLTIEDTPALFINMEFMYEPEISPDGKYILFFDKPMVKIVDTEILDVVSQIETTEFCVSDMAFTGDSKRVCLTYWFDYPYFDIIYLDGENSYLENTISTNGEMSGISVAFNQLDQNFYIARCDDIWVVDPESANVICTINYPLKQSPQVQIEIDPQGHPIINTYNYIYTNNEEYFLRESIRRFQVDYFSQKCLAPSPGPDKIYLLDFLTTELHEINVSKQEQNIQIFPNPANEMFSIRSDKKFSNIEIFSSNGRKIFENMNTGFTQIIHTKNYNNGLYFVRVSVNGKHITSKVIVNK